MVWCFVSEMWFDVECINQCISVAPRHIITTTLCIIPRQTPSLTLFQIAPHYTSHHHSSNISHISYRTAPLAVHYSILQYHVSNRTTITQYLTPLDAKTDGRRDRERKLGEMPAYRRLQSEGEEREKTRRGKYLFRRLWFAAPHWRNTMHTVVTAATVNLGHH